MRLKAHSALFFDQERWIWQAVPDAFLRKRLSQSIYRCLGIWISALDEGPPELRLAQKALRT